MRERKETNKTSPRRDGAAEGTTSVIPYDPCRGCRKSEFLHSLGNAKGIAVSEVEQYLESYRTFVRMMEMNEYERTYFAPVSPYAGVRTEESEAYLQGRLYEIRAFILSIPQCEEKLFLYYHYVHGENPTRCAELLGVSRATAYRLRTRALRIAAYYYDRQRGRAI